MVTTQKIFVFTLLSILLGVAFFFEKKGYLNLDTPGSTPLIAPNVAQQPLSEIDTSISIEVDDLLKIVYALDRYKQDHRSYPISSSSGDMWDGIISSYGESREDWIRGLVPKYIDHLPKDPRSLNDGTRQYIYKSNGANYKLIVHRANTNCPLIKQAYPNLIDPKRDCFAFGFWTKKAAAW